MRPEPAWRRYARFFGADPRADVDDEITFHYEMRVRDYIARGYTAGAARQAANERLGDLDSVRRDCVDIGEITRKRDRMNELKQDIRYGARMLRRSPGFAIVSVLTLALGIGATTAIFSVVHRVLLAPLPYAQSDRIVSVWEVTPRGKDHNVVSDGNYLDWSAHAHVFKAIAASHGATALTITSPQGDARHANVGDMTPSAAEVFPVRPIIGRTFNPADDKGKGDVVLLSEDTWRTRYGADPSVLGRTVVLNSEPYSIVGVMPRSFEFPSPGIDMWRPLPHASFDPTERRSHNHLVAARLADGVTLQRAQQEMSNLAHSISEQYPENMKGWGVNVIGMHDDLISGMKPLLFVISLTVVLVLLISCGNLANLLLARAVTRQQEMAMRGALGASRARIVRQMLTESLILAALGGIAAVATAAALIRVLLSIAPDGLPMVSQIAIDPTVLVFALALTGFCTILFGLAPALWISNRDLTILIQSARGGSSARGAGKARAALLVAEIALSFVLLTGAGLLMRSYMKLQHVDLGFNPQQLAEAQVDVPMSRYPSIEQQSLFYQTLIANIAAIPGVQSVAASNHAPGAGGNMTFSFGIEGRTATNASGREDPEQLHVVTADYFSTIGMNIMQGRAFTDADRPTTDPVVVISESLARKHWPDGDAVGRRISFRPGEKPWMTIVGVVNDARFDSPDAQPEPAIFMPYAQRPEPWMTWMGIVVRMKPRINATSMLPRIRAASHEIDNAVAIDSFDRVQDLYGTTIARRTFALILVGAFAALALALSIVGLYGLMSYTVEQQRREIGVRLALGAGRGHVLANVLGASMRLCLIGLGVGLPLAMAGSGFLASLLFDVPTRDPLTLVGTGAILAATATLAALLPARRAARTEPMTAIRLG